jgi:hypothetical protein
MCQGLQDWAHLSIGKEGSCHWHQRELFHATPLAKWRRIAAPKCEQHSCCKHKLAMHPAQHKGNIEHLDAVRKAVLRLRNHRQVDVRCDVSRSFKKSMFRN